MRQYSVTVLKLQFKLSENEGTALFFFKNNAERRDSLATRSCGSIYDRLERVIHHDGYCYRCNTIPNVNWKVATDMFATAPVRQSHCLFVNLKPTAIITLPVYPQS